MVALRPLPVAEKGSKSAVKNKEHKEVPLSTTQGDYILDGKRAWFRSHHYGVNSKFRMQNLEL